MFRLLLLLVALLLFALSTLTVIRSPDWSPWRLAVLAGEYGHWFVVVAVILAAVAWGTRGGPGWVAGGTVTLSLAAAALFARPSLAAAEIAAKLPRTLTGEFGAPALGERKPFSMAELFFGRAAEPVARQTHTVAPGLPLDYYPAVRAASAGPAPCVVVIHGGGWDSGDRTQIPHFNHWLARCGYAVAAISYRLAPQHQWPAQRDDTLAAIGYLKAHAKELGLDPTRFVLLGRSAGGQIAETVGYTAEDPAIRGVVGLYAPSDIIFGYVNTHENDMLKSPGLMRQYLGGPPETARANYESASALFHVSPRTPPTLLLHGTIDALCWYRHSVRLDACLAAQHVPRVFVALPWATHAFDFNLHGPGGQLTRFSLEWFLARVTA
jgi:acetyl esterase/lipase